MAIKLDITKKTSSCVSNTLHQLPTRDQIKSKQIKEINDSEVVNKYPAYGRQRIS